MLRPLVQKFARAFEKIVVPANAPDAVWDSFLGGSVVHAEMIQTKNPVLAPVLQRDSKAATRHAHRNALALILGVPAPQ